LRGVADGFVGRFHAHVEFGLNVDAHAVTRDDRLFLERVTSKRSVFMLTQMMSWKIGNTGAPRLRIILLPPRPVRTTRVRSSAAIQTRNDDGNRQQTENRHAAKTRYISVHTKLLLPF
jgi:hypothetical protein